MKRQDIDNRKQIDDLNTRIDVLTKEINATNFEQKHREIGALQLKIESIEQPTTNIMDWGHISPAPKN